MSKILYIKANAKPEGISRTFQLSDYFINDYMQKNPNDLITTLDLYKEDIKFLTEKDITTIFSAKNDESKKHPILKYSYQFIEADKYIIAAPLWNLGVPSILKAYIDYISVSGVTFEYTEQGPIGLCTGKKAINIMTSGGDYTSPNTADYDVSTKYLKTIFAFLGITDFSSITAGNLDIIGADVEAQLSIAKMKCKDLASVF